MIPHCAAAILMSEQAVLHDSEVKKLALTFNSSQRAEIELIKAILNEIDPQTTYAY
ncbi:hypothetical protein GCM10028818_54390 [Spirosoma horti]